MDFDLSESQNMLLDTAKKFLEKEAKGIARQAEKTDAGYSPELWQKIAELGWIGLVFPEQYGGIEGTFQDLVLLVEEMGKALFPGPFTTTVISGLSILEHGNSSQRDAFLSALTAGGLIISPALIKPDPLMDESIVPDQASMKDGKYLLSGTRLFVPYGHVAGRFIYDADTDKGKTLFLIDAGNPGIRCTPLVSIAGDKPCEVIFEGVEVSEEDIIGAPGKAEEIIGKINTRGALLESAYICGMLEQVLKMTVEYANEREQFGNKIGALQCIQHQCADMATDIDQVKFLTYEAAWKISEGLPAVKEVSMAKSWASDASRRVCLLGVKIHGGTGVMEEHDMQIYFRKAKAEELAFGDGDFHREIVAAQLGL